MNFRLVVVFFQNCAKITQKILINCQITYRYSWTRIIWTTRTGIIWWYWGARVIGSWWASIIWRYWGARVIGSWWAGIIWRYWTRIVWPFGTRAIWSSRAIAESNYGSFSCRWNKTLLKQNHCESFTFEYLLISLSWYRNILVRFGAGEFDLRRFKRFLSRNDLSVAVMAWATPILSRSRGDRVIIDFDRLNSGDFIFVEFQDHWTNRFQSFNLSCPFTSFVQWFAKYKNLLSKAWFEYRYFLKHTWAGRKEFFLVEIRLHNAWRCGWSSTRFLQSYFTRGFTSEKGSNLKLG